MNLLGPYVHDIDPILGKLTGFYLWWYGLGYTLGFLHLHLFFLRRRSQLGLTHRQVYTLSLLIIFGVLIGGRGIEVAFDEWPFYSEHPWLIPAFWLGGMASHGVLLGAALGAGTFALIYRTPFLRLADELVIPGTVLMGFGRIGNFIDGMIVGGLTDVPWGGEISICGRFPSSGGSVRWLEKLSYISLFTVGSENKSNPRCNGRPLYILVCISSNIHRSLP
jgi:phosphatidylglycerol:prolipoprotein diacylglycerol transferase